MNVTIAKKEKPTKKRLTIYFVILAFCVIAIAIAIYQFFKDEKLGVIIGITSSSSQEEYNLLKAEFNNIFNNNLNGDLSENFTINKINMQENLIYTNYSINESSENNYDLDVNIPIINIESDVVEKLNQEISDSFEQKAESVLVSENKNIIYSVNYTATIIENILSVVIHANLREENNAQRLIIQTYNYDLQNDKELYLSDILSLSGIDESEAQKRILEEIKDAQEQAEELIALGYNVYSRDYNSDIYSIENSTEFFIYNNYLYIIYAYGNQENTNAYDIVIY